MNRSETRIGLLSTAKDFGLVEETFSAMGLEAATTEVTAIITAGNEEGRGKNAFADRTIAALNAAGITQIQEIDVAGKDEEEVSEQLTSDPNKAPTQLIVITGGDKQYLHRQLRSSKAGQIIVEQVESGERPILTVSAGTVLMGRRLDVANEQPRGLDIVPATVVCHFTDEREERVRQDLDTTAGLQKYPIWGLRDEHSLVGHGNVFQVVGEGDLTILTTLPQQTEPQLVFTRTVDLR